MDCEHNKRMNIDGKAKWCMDCGAIKPCNFEIWSSPKAPKNELLPLDRSKLRNLWDKKYIINKDISGFLDEVCSKFGSSGKRSLSQYDLSVFLRKQPFLSHLQADLLAERVVKEFSTAEVSLEAIQRGIDNWDSILFITPTGKEELAKAIKAELDVK